VRASVMGLAFRYRPVMESGDAATRRVAIQLSHRLLVALTRSGSVCGRRDVPDSRVPREARASPRRRRRTAPARGSSCPSSGVARRGEDLRKRRANR
jgi:hypothetical protein